MKQDRSRRSHDRILAAAAVEFYRYGFAAAVLEQIVEQAGLTKGALYGHFASKRQLADVLIDYVDEVAAALVAQAPPGQPVSTALGRLFGAFGERIAVDVRFRAGLRLCLEEARAADSEPMVVATVRQGVRAVCEVAGPEGQPRWAADTEAVADLALALLFGFCGPGLGSTVEDLPDRLLRIQGVLLLLAEAAT
ncbi:TetR family transcriptional regulator [Streptacidiphilus sp. MAP5-3]|uniref:TetR family transcriptional regulator n=1 Tax=unclassified Streptacidiphilus TaxID=2643834 RepID=UPI0035197752